MSRTRRRVPEKPLNRCSLDLALAIRRVTARYGSLAAFFEHCEREQEAHDKAACREQRKLLELASQPAPT